MLITRLTTVGFSHSNTPQVSLPGMEAFSNHDIIDCNLTDECVKLIARHCPNLKKLLLPECRLSDEAFKFLLKRCRQITHLHVSGKKMTAGALMRLAENPEWAPELEKLRIKASITDSEFMHGVRGLGRARKELLIEVEERKSENSRAGGYGKYLTLSVSHQTYKGGRKISRSFGRLQYGRRRY